MPTKPEDLLVINSKTATGFTVFSPHTWSKDLKIPDNVDFDTLDAQMKENILIVSAKFKDENKKEKKDEAVQIPIEKLD